MAISHWITDMLFFPRRAKSWPVLLWLWLAYNNIPIKATSSSQALDLLLHVMTNGKKNKNVKKYSWETFPVCGQKTEKSAELLFTWLFHCLMCMIVFVPQNTESPQYWVIVTD